MFYGRMVSKLLTRYVKTLITRVLQGATFLFAPLPNGAGVGSPQTEISSHAERAGIRTGGHFQLRAHGGEAPAVRELQAIHAAAVAAPASDIHLEPTLTGGRIRERTDGILRETRVCEAELFAQLVSRVKLIAGMDIADKRQPQDGRYSIEQDGRIFEARVSSTPTIAGEKLVIRLLDHYGNAPSLEALGMPSSVLERFHQAVCAPHGFIVVCGPTGSGKTTTLYAALRSRDVETDNICTVEDPVEIRIPGLSQVQVNPKAGVTFASALRSFVRQDPNVIMVGEMRDSETALVASSAALSGQLVMTTLHANDAATAVDRLRELGVSHHTIASSLTAVVSQRLLRRRCATCHGEGCVLCCGSGLRGRVAAFEMLTIDDALRALIAGGAPGFLVAQEAARAGFTALGEHALDLMRSGQTSASELRRVLALSVA